MMTGNKNQFYAGKFDATTIMVVLCSGLTFYNALELQLLIFTTFKAYRGIYFWSLVAASFGLVPYVVGFGLGYFRILMSKGVTPGVGLFIITIGWILVVTGHAVVLYSRLWIVFGHGHHRILKVSKWMIIITGVIAHVTSTGRSSGLGLYTFN